MPRQALSDRFNCLIAPVQDRDVAPSGPLAGLSYAVKDLFDVAGLPTTAGSPEFADWHGLPAEDAWVVRTLRAAGAELVAKTHLHELAYGITGVNPHFGTPANPRDPQRISGGSSSGSAVAVAAGLVAFALGTDTGGSVRVPASLCGLYGFRPTHGAIPEEGVVALAPSFDTVGVFARDAAPLATVARLLLRPAAPCPTARLRGGAVLAEALSLADAEGRAAVARVAEALRALGLETAESDLECLEEARQVQQRLQGAEAWSVHATWIEARQPRLGADVAALLERGSKLDAVPLGWASAQRAMLTHRVERLLAAGRVLLLPASPGPAPLRAELEDAEAALEIRRRLMLLTNLASLAGLPVVTVPAAQGDALPVGVQLVGPRGSDPVLLELAERLGALLASSE